MADRAETKARGVSARVWETCFAEFTRFRRRFGHGKVPPDWHENRPLAKWVINQQHRHSQLSLDQLKRLYELGFPFSRSERQWFFCFFALVEQQGLSRPSRKSPPRPHRDALRRWVHFQRVRRRKGRLELDRLKRLHAIGFDWQPRRSGWERRIAELRAFKDRHGHCNFLLVRGRDSSLVQWASHQRQRRARLSSREVKQLNEAGFVWSPNEGLWEREFNALVQFKKRFGHCHVPAEWTEKPFLGHWLNYQRAKYHRLLPERKRRLEKIGVIFRHYESLVWEQRFQELVAFKKRYGHCYVPLQWKQNQPFALWVHRLREPRYRALLSPERVRRLNAIGFDWMTRSERLWSKGIAGLCAFKKRHGHCNGPVQWKENPQLANWVPSVRQRRRRGQLSADRIQQLTALGFDWNPLQTQWEQNFQQLVAFRKQHGHLHLPFRKPKFCKLYTWVALMRRGHIKSTAQQRRKLDRLGFQWNPLNERWEAQFESLRAFRKKHSHCNVPDGWQKDPSLGFWVTTQRRRQNRMSHYRRDRLSALGFVWHFGQSPRRSKLDSRPVRANPNLPGRD